MAEGGSDFISKGQFKKLADKKKEEEKDVKSWGDLPTDVIYRIKQIEKKNGKFGECYILTSITKSRQEIKVWSPKKLIEEFEEEQKKTKPRTLYFCSLGQVRKQDGSGHMKNVFDSCFL